MALPLQGHRLFRSGDLDHVRDEMSRILCPHDVVTLERDARIDAEMNSLALGNVVLNYVHYGAAVAVDPGLTHDFIALQVPIAGCATITSGSEKLLSTPDRMLISRNTEPLSMRLSADARLLLTKLSWPFLQGVLSDLLGGYVPWPLRFELGLDCQGARQRRWVDFLLTYVRRASNPEHGFRRRLWEGHFQESLAVGLLRVQPNSYSAVLETRPLPAPPYTLRRAIDILESTPEEAHTEGSLARDLDISTRALDEAFRSRLSQSIPGYLYHVRMRRAYLALRWAEPGDVTVESVAERWGFTEPGFSKWYYREFGETPQQTRYS
ncbi:Helix-turn-helix domain-containing protein [Amycolatopsis sacchari]|uniref:Helix-turn-helix domain-containing protein n=2 Tax=Amycolatopsis sacchari TaxID=115433 RepID=A0A1I3UZ66_9PSEU|nr:Helix-turn-helix domain-containing protein [Amycolatopsis sacchari]